MRVASLASLFAGAAAGVFGIDRNFTVLDIRNTDAHSGQPSSPDKHDGWPLRLAVLACSGFFNREGSPRPSVLVTKDDDQAWLAHIEDIDVDTDPNVLTDVWVFLRRCLEHTGRHIVRWGGAAPDQQRLVGPIMTLAGVLDAVPVTDAILKRISTGEHNSIVTAFDALEKFGAPANASSAAEATAYVFDEFGPQTSGLAKINPGLETSKQPFDPPLTRLPAVDLADWVVSRRLFAFFLNLGCIPGSAEHALMERMVGRRAPPGTPGSGAGSWGQGPFPVWGYDNTFQLGGCWFEAETLCTAERNLGAVASEGCVNLSFFGRKERGIQEPLEQVEEEAAAAATGKGAPHAVGAAFEADPLKTYVMFVVGDGDNLDFVKGSRREWMEARVRRCASAGSDGNSSAPPACVPLAWTISPHALYAAPDWVRWYYAQAKKTRADFFVLPPSGHLYAYPSMMREEDRLRFVARTDEDARMLDAEVSVTWELFFEWGRAVQEYLPQYADRASKVRGFVAVNVPYDLPTVPTVFGWLNEEFYRVIRGRAKGLRERAVEKLREVWAWAVGTSGGDAAAGAAAGAAGAGAEPSPVVLFRPREWRGTDGAAHEVPFSRRYYLSLRDMAEEINGYPRGTVTALYLTSDGGLDLGAVDGLLPLLAGHVQVVGPRALVAAALQLAPARQAASHGGLGPAGTGAAAGAAASATGDPRDCALGGVTALQEAAATGAGPNGGLEAIVA